MTVERTAAGVAGLLVRAAAASPLVPRNMLEELRVKYARLWDDLQKAMAAAGYWREMACSLELSVTTRTRQRDEAYDRLREVVRWLDVGYHPQMGENTMHPLDYLVSKDVLTPEQAYLTSE